MIHKRVTLKEVAIAAGVSTASVSRAIAGKATVSAERQARIMAAASRLEYVPNPAARALASRRSGLVALVVRPMDDGVVIRTATATLRVFERHGCNALVLAGPGAEQADISKLAKRSVEAVLYIGRPPLAAEREALSVHRLRWFSMTDDQNENDPWVELGRVSGVELACRYLREVGHRKFAVLASPGLAIDRLVRRLSEEGMAIDWVEVASSGDPVALRNGLLSRFDAPDRPSAVVCADDLTALAVVRECALRGIAVPRDLAVIGFGDEPFARCSRPALTTVRPAYADIGHYAAEAMLTAIAGRPYAPYRPSHKLIVRETTQWPGDPPRSTWNHTTSGST